MEFLEPIFTVGQQEVKNFVFSIVKTQTVPCRMLVSVSGIKILVRVASQVTQSLTFVFYSVAMHDVHNYRNTVLVGCVNKQF